ncbi:HEAT repeat domain-containing protein [Cyanobium sp. WAJ14-Wanaka]|uniref:HEAT repeat domain-containing protein n=1 Tax=Cyanobium sp. WAJ14-Wanaka TaxID=2823725 RepID=UPI0020CF9DBB|nr:HEAT repeat domain-containing protein [Cyanobium sp. WAJ14-Wanaka]MCP9775979.1 HEAT repeat domain-containing protein [Cyanobium sp. WAJ14-Wanaka]
MSASRPVGPDLDALIRAVRKAASSEALLLATQELASCGQPGAAPTLVEVLGFNNPGAAVAAVDGLIGLGPTAVEALLLLDQQNYGARAWAVRALAGIGDVRGLELLLDALGSDVAASVRRAAAKGLGQLQLAELEARRQQEIRCLCLEALLAACGDGEWVVRYAVVVGLEALGAGLELGSEGHGKLLAGLGGLQRPSNENPKVVQLRANLALERLQSP